MVGEQLSQKDIPIPLAATLLRAPMSRMDILDPSEIKALVKKSKLTGKYNEEVDREGAYDILKEKIEDAQSEEKQAEL